MRKKRLQEVSEVLVRNHRRRSWRRRVGALACAVAVATSSLLIHPAMTLEKAAKCGLTEHTHTEACYDSLAEAGKSVPVCTPESLGLHQHTEACRNENGDLICGYSDFVVHQHDASCYGEDGTLWCSLPEIEVHIHDENCYSDPKTDSVSAHTHTEACYGQKRGDLICGYATEGHVHTDECYEEKETLVCPVLEGHKHDESCFDGNGVMVCGVEEDNGHIHGAECYETTRELVCAYGETAHQHTDECYTWIMEPVCGFSAESAQPELICGKEEVLLHEHTDTCFDADGNVICGQTQVLKHVHTDDCFQAVEEAADAKTLICEMEEHIHTQECFADQTVDLESSDTQGESEPVDTSTESEPAGAESGPADAPGEIGYDSAAEESGSADVPGESAGAPEFTMVRMAADGVAHWVMGAEGTDHSWQTLDAQEIIRIEDGSGNTAKIMPLTAGKVFLVHNYKVGDELHMETFEVDVVETAEETPAKKPDTDTAGETPAEKPEADTMGETPAEKSEPETVIKETEETDPSREPETEAATEETEETDSSGEPEKEAATEETEETDPIADSEKESENGDVIAETEDRIAEEESETETETETDSVLEYTQSVAELAGLAGRLSPAGIAGNLASLANRNQSAASAISVPAASDPSLAHRRMIDAFGDGVDNPDTTVDDNTAEDHSNLYRQYLDVTGAAEPMDVLFVVDCSDDAVAVDGTANDGTAVGGTADGGAAAGGTANDGTAADGQTARLEAAEAYLKGEDGLAARILAQNAENRIAVCAIDGKAAGEESLAQLSAETTDPAAASNPAVAAEPTILPNVGMTQGLIALPNGVASPDAAVLPDEGTVQDTAAQPDQGTVQDATALPDEGTVQDTAAQSDAGAVQDAAAQPDQAAAQVTTSLSDQGAVQDTAAPESAAMSEPTTTIESVAAAEPAASQEPVAAMEPADSPESESSVNKGAAQNSGVSSDPVAEDPMTAPKPVVSQEPVAAEDTAAAPKSAISQKPEPAEDSVAAPEPAAAEKPTASTGAAAVAGGTVLVDWTGEGLSEELSLAAAKEERDQASDGSAAIGRAEELFLADAVKENGHKKVVVFLDSDALVDDLGTDRVNNVSYFDAAADDKESLTTWLQELSMPKAVSITDQLSAYMDFCADQPDYKVTMEDAAGAVTVLYEGGTVTEAGTGILQEIVYDEPSRTVSALFCEDYRLQPGCRYTVSFNTMASGQAYEEYYESGYPTQGDADTDYAENQTSSDQMGFYVDDAASVSYQIDGTSYSETYDRPVMQIAEMAMMLAEGDTSGSSSIGADFSDVTLPRSKKIDAFRDKEDNPDTTADTNVTGESNLHRLYLDVTTPAVQNKPTDLLLVLDNSYSMFVLNTNNTVENKQRNQAMKDALTNFIPEFLKACPGNRVSIVYFSGPAFNWGNWKDKAGNSLNGGQLDDVDQVNSPVIIKDPDSGTEKTIEFKVDGLEGDSWTACEWTDDENKAVSSLLDYCKNHSTSKTNSGGGSGTNYAAGLKQAKASLGSADSAHNVAMMFLSDGVPTHYIDGAYRGGNGLASEYANGEENLEFGKANEGRCKAPTLEAIKSFQGQYPKLPVYTVSFCTRENKPDYDFDYDYALSAMPQNGGTFGKANTTAELQAALEKILAVPVSNVSITDKLSAYVDLYAEQPDYKVTRTRVSDDYTETLYEKGSITTAGTGVLSSVGLDESDQTGKTVSAKFADTYVLEEGWTYTLSFNVIASQQAHKEFAEKSGSAAYGEVTGDKDTDYDTNNTSSEQPGFRSNDAAFVTYKVADKAEPKKDDYQHPVIQVKNTEVTVEKKWFEEINGTLTDVTVQKTDGSITFDLIQIGNQAKMSEAPGMVDVNVYYKRYMISRLIKTESVQDESWVTIKVTPGRYDKFDGLEIGESAIEKDAMEFQDSQYLYTTRVSGKTDVTILTDNPNINWEVTFEPVEPGEVLNQFGEPVVYGEYTIGSGDSWRKIISDLPASGTVDGKDIQYTYKVEEHGDSSYDTMYENNGGIKNGEIIIKNILKPKPSGGGTTDTPTIDHYKTIDAFRDGAENPDTNLDNNKDVDKTDLYRLYLDITGKTEPMDVLFVVDRSYSMDERDITINKQPNQQRLAAVQEFLGGNNGFIEYILSQNSANKIAVCSFSGMYPNWNATYQTDSTVIQNWISGELNSFSLSKPGTPWFDYRTNYCAGIRTANDMFQQVANDNNKKVMIFLSDGVPTLYLDKDNNWSRGGNGNYWNQRNVEDCKKYAMQTFDWFKQQNPNVIVYTIGLSADITTDSWRSSPEVLQYMATKGNGKFIGIEQDMDALRTELEAIFMPGNVTIRDTLSAYTEVYTDQLDYKVVMEPVEGTDGEKKTLYDSSKEQEDGSYITADGKGVIQSVTYNPETKTVTAKFADNYMLRPEYRYILSFNIKATPEAYMEYAGDRKAGEDGYNNTKGDSGTDYPGNKTSSDQAGFHSNEKASVTYTIRNRAMTEDYKHPVIQVSDCSLKVTKEWLDADGKPFTPTLPNQEIQFKLMQIANPVNIAADATTGGGEGTATGGMDDTTTGSGEGATAGGGQGTTAQNTPVVYGTYTICMKSEWSYTIEHLPLKGRKDGREVKYSYRVEEIPIEGYETTYKSDYNPTDTYAPDSYDKNGNVPDGEITITNTAKPSYELPATGGSGTTTLYTIGGLLTGIAGLLLLYNDKKRRKEGFAS